MANPDSSVGGSRSDESEPSDGAARATRTDDTQQPDAETPSASQVTSPLRRLLEAICESVINCPIPNDDLLLPRAFFHAQEGDDLLNCIDYYSGYGNEQNQTDTEAFLDYFLRAEADGGLRIAWDRLNELSECSAPLVSLKPFLEGQRQEGEECHLHDECVDGYCDARASCPGSCVPGLENGEACSDAEQCSSKSCDGELCVAASNAEVGVAFGEPCSYFGRERRYCAAGLWCNDQRVCQVPISPGEPCTSIDDVCADGHLCVPLPEEAGQERRAVCARVELLAIGEPCEEDLLATDGRLLTCDRIALETCRDGKCTQLSEGTAGDECASNDQTSTCSAGHYCDWGGSGCQPSLSVGDACSASQECNCHDGQCVESYCSYSDW